MHNYNKDKIKNSVKKAFLQTHEGRSSDDIIIDDTLNYKFMKVAKKFLPDFNSTDINWELLNLRKSGNLGSVAKYRVVIKNQEDYLHASEIAARIMEDKYNMNIDRVMCDYKLRSEFDQLAKSIVPGYSEYEYRKAALKLRKTGKLKPELLKRVLRLGKSITFTNVEKILNNPDLIPILPGIYIFVNHKGAIYIGETKNLRTRVLKHLDHSDRKSLAHYFWEKGLSNIKVEIICFKKGTHESKTQVIDI